MMTHLHAGLSCETTEKARVELNENPETLHQDIQQVLGRCEEGGGGGGGGTFSWTAALKMCLRLRLLRFGT